MYKVLFFNDNSCTGFSMEFNNRENALHAFNWYIKQHGASKAEVFDDRTESQKANEDFRRKK